MDQSEEQFIGINLNKWAIHNIWFGKKRMHSCKQRTFLTFSFKKRNDPFENELFPFECILHVNYDKTDSLCLLLLHPSQPYPPLIAYSSPPSKYWQREAHGAQRGLGDVLAVTHDATINTKASFRRTGHFEVDLELLATFNSQTTFFHPRVFSVRFPPRFFPLHNISATDLNDLSFLLFPLEEQKRCKPLGVGETNSVEQYLFTEYRQRGWFRRAAQFRTKVGAKRTNGTRMRHPNPRRRTPASKKAR